MTPIEKQSAGSDVSLWRRCAVVIVWATLAFALGAAEPAPAPEETELIRDPHFRQGFILHDPKPGKWIVYGTLVGRETTASPVWKLAQWSSKFPLKAAGPERLKSGAWRFGNEAKTLTLGAPGTAEADAAFAVNAQPEYGARARQTGEPWVHLLVEQRFEQPPALPELRSLRLRVEARLLRAKKLPMAGYSPGLHAAQFQIFLTVQNMNRASPGYGRYLWFGIPIYDDRHRFPPEHKTKDTGGTDMFIFTPRGETFTTASAHDGGWVTIDRDILPLLREALATAWERHLLTESKAAADYRVTGMNMGWEVPGIFDVEVQVRNLSLRPNAKPAAE